MHALIKKAQEFAHAGHDSIGQVRKYTGGPYWVHTDEVAKIIHKISVPELTQMALDHVTAEIVAHLHDLVEDVNVYPYDLQGIKDNFGEQVASWVHQLTHKYTNKDYPNLNRAERKVLEAHRLSQSHPWVQTVKVADLISNTKSIVDNDPNFAKVYLKEKGHLLDVLIDADETLLRRAKKQLTRERNKLNMNVD